MAHSAFCFVKLLKKIIIIIIRRHFFCDVFALCRVAAQGGGVGRPCEAAEGGEGRRCGGGAAAVVCREVLGGCVGRWREAHPPKKQPREFSQTLGVNDVCQFMASISGVDIVCDDYMAK